MSNQHHIIISQRSAKQLCLADQNLCGTDLNSRHLFSRNRFSVDLYVRALSLFVLIFMLSTGFTASAYADDTQRTRAQAVEIAKSRSGNGRVLSVKKMVDENGDSVFAVKIITDGRVKIYAIPEFTN